MTHRAWSTQERAWAFCHASFTQSQLVRFGRSYTSLAKRATLFGYALDGALKQVRWRRLEEEMYGEPLYKRLLRQRRD